MKSPSALSCCGLRVLGVFLSLTTIVLLVVSMTYYGIQSSAFTHLRQCVSSKDSEQQSTREGAAFGSNTLVFSTTMEFKENDEYQDLSHESDFMWQNLLTSNGGFLIKVDEEGTAYRHGIGMFHQLHCLQMIRRALQERTPQSSREYAMYNKHGTGEHQDDGHDPELHMLHCLDYLRQIVMCMADDTIEPPKRNALGRGVIDGMTPHQCRNSKVLYDMSEASPPWYKYASGSDQQEVRGEDHDHMHEH